jgi:hypothetical protein
MSPPDRTRGARRAARSSACAAAALVVLALLGVRAAAAAEPRPYRHAAPIVVEQPAPFVQLALPPTAYGRVEQGDLRDLRIVDARGERVPFAVLPARASVHTSEQVREATLYPLPARPSASGTWPSPVDVVVDGDRIRGHRHGGDAPTAAGAAGASAGWLIDSGEARAGEPPPRSLRLRWSGPGEFSAAYRIETSADLRQWRDGGAGQVMALQGASGVLAQPLVGLGAAPGRFVRLVWADPRAAPMLTGATAVVAASHQVALETTRELTFAPSAAPDAGRDADAAPRGALDFDLGGALPLIDVDLRFAAGTHVAPVRLQGRTRAEQPWRDLGTGVFFRLEHGNDVATAPAIALPATVRYLRVVPDSRAAALDPARVRLAVHADLATLVFATQGEPPFRLLAGSADAAAAALPLALVVPQLESERARFGRATLGAFAIDRAAEQAAERAAQRERLRPWLLWAVLLVGVGARAALVWRLARSGAPAA